MTDRREKPAGSSWTDDQWAAITLRGGNLLVAAAAGAGKTAVLVERIIRRITDERDPVDIDRLLVATFTNAAAAEMRDRIREALEKELQQNPESAHVGRQLALLGRAQITTLHSFCQEVIRRHGHAIRLDPGFRVANETEAQLIKQDVLDELFEQLYAENGEDSEFWRLAEWFGGERGDEGLSGLVLQLYEYSRSHPWPEHWLQEMAGLFLAAREENGTGNPWLESLIEDVRLELDGVEALLGQALLLAEKPGGPKPYAETLREDMEAIARLREAARKDWNELFAAFQNVRFGKLKACRGDHFDKALQEQARQLRGRAKEQLGALREELFTRSWPDYRAELAEMAPLLQHLVGIVNAFARNYRREKARKNVVDFSDLEHYCLEILRDSASTPGNLVPSAVASEYREQFVEILLDEYQDTNQVQESIVELISRKPRGNCFMVGDVKQSIYRFRLAEPGLFLQKYRTYAGLKDLKGPEQEQSGEGRGTGANKEAEGREHIGTRIDLAQNFRSRREVIDGVNFVFRQVMDERVGEIGYDGNAELVAGAGYPDAPPGRAFDYAVELAILEKDRDESGRRDGENGTGAEYAEEDDDSAENYAEDEAEQEKTELESVRMEARYIAARILELTGKNGSGTPPFQVYDKKTAGMRPVTFRDMVILLRSAEQWAPVLTEELRAQGIPAYAELSTGYFGSTEIEVMLSLLSLIDNPVQDIPLASVLRSPIVGLTAEHLAQIRIRSKGVSFYEAVMNYAGFRTGQLKARDRNGAEASPGDGRNGVSGGLDEGACGPDEGVGGSNEGVGGPDEGLPVDPDLRNRLAGFIRQLEQWREEARQGSLSGLIWKLYGQTGYYDFVGGLPGGLQRQANLRALYDRARQYEATSFRGLFRFLRFIGRLKDSGGDLGTARALGEQEDVVRIMTIHKSKGLEFPVVFVAGLAKLFNMQDLHAPFLMHRQLGFGPKFTDLQNRVSYPSLPALAIRRRMRRELLAEEMRVLYVALTRAREKLYLIGTVKAADKLLSAWARHLRHDDWKLPPYELAQARCYLDWIGPAVIRHPLAALLRERAGASDSRSVPSCMAKETSVWNVHIAPAELFRLQAAAAQAHVREEDGLIQSVKRLEAASGMESPYRAEIGRRLSWRDPMPEWSVYFAKTSVTELKRLSDYAMAHLFSGTEEDVPLLPEAGEGGPGALAPSGFAFPSGLNAAPAGNSRSPAGSLALRRPRFMEKLELTPAERGTVVHTVMQHIPLNGEVTEETVQDTVRRLLDRQLLTQEQAEAVDPEAICGFFRHEVGRRLLRARQVYREVPFSYGLSAQDAYRIFQPGAEHETVLVQGVIDCLFAEEEGFVLVDYKTDAVGDGRLEYLTNRYSMQIGLYARAVEQIWKRPVIHKYLYFFDGGHVVPV